MTTATAGYSLVDRIGARQWGAPLAFMGWLLMLTRAVYVPVALALRGPRIFRAPWRCWAFGMVRAAAPLWVDAIDVWAMTQAPIALVTALRETSILFAVPIGWLVFGERMGPAKALATRSDRARRGPDPALTPALAQTTIEFAAAIAEHWRNPGRRKPCEPDRRPRRWAPSLHPFGWPVRRRAKPCICAPVLTT